MIDKVAKMNNLGKIYSHGSVLRTYVARHALGGSPSLLRWPDMPGYQAHRIQAPQAGP